MSLLSTCNVVQIADSEAEFDELELELADANSKISQQQVNNSAAGKILSDSPDC